MAGPNDDEQSPLPWLGQPVMPPMEDDEETPTFGQRIGARPGAYVLPNEPPKSVAPQSKIDFDPSKLPASLRPPTPAPSSVPVPPSGSSNPNLVDLAKQQAKFGTPLDRNAVDPQTGKPMYKMGIGGKILGTIGNFASGLRGGGVVSDVSSGATNTRYARDNADRQANLANVNTQIGTQEKLDSQNQKMYEDAIKQAYEGQLGAAKAETAASQTSKAETASQLADIKALATKNQFDEAKSKLEEQARRNDDLLRMGQGNLELKQQLGELAIQLKQQQLENDKAKFSTGTDAKSLEAERKQRLTAIEDDWKQHPYMNKLFGDKDKEIKTVNNDINSRLRAVGVGTGAPGSSSQKPTATPAAPNQPPTPQTHTWSRGAWKLANPKGNVQAAEQQAKQQHYMVIE